MNEKTGLEHYEKLYGDLNLPPDDAAKWIFLSGWNSAMGEAMRRVNSMPFQNDTRASFAVYFQKMMVLDPEAVKEKPAPLQEPHKGLSEHLAQATNGRVRIDPVTGDVGIGTPSYCCQKCGELIGWLGRAMPFHKCKEQA
jgi:hypothetical protein